MSTHRRRFVAVIAALCVLLLGGTPASAYWTSTGSGTAITVTGTLASPVNVTVQLAASAQVSVTWTRGTGGVDPAGYYVLRDTGTAQTPACGSSPTALVGAVTQSCTDASVPAGTYSYLVTAVYASWTAVSQPSAQVTVPDILLGAAESYSVLAATAVSSTGATVVSGDLGVSPATTVTGFGPGTVGGDIHQGDAHAAAAQSSFDSAYIDLAARTATASITTDLGGQTLTPGTYHSVAALALTGTLTLDAGNDPDAVFIFQVDAAFNVAADSTVLLTNGAQASNVYWVVAGAAGVGASSVISGTILARGAITLGAGSTLIGRALSGGTVTLAANTIRFTQALPPTITIDGGPAFTTKDDTPTISGTSSAAVSSPVTVNIAGQTLSTTVTAGGTWSVTAAALAAGQYTIAAKVRDSSGNGSSASQTLTLEVNPAPVTLGVSSTFSVLAYTSVVNTGSTVLSGDLGVSPATSVTGFPPGVLAGNTYAGDSTAAAAQAALLTALDDGSAHVKHTEILTDLGGRTFHAGVHHSTAALGLTGTVVLDGEGNSDAVFIFQSDAAFNTAASSTVSLINGAQAANVFWIVTGAAGTGASSSLAGSILARGAITLGAGTTLVGQALSRDTVTLAGNTLTGVAPAPAAAGAVAAEPASVSGETWSADAGVVPAQKVSRFTVSRTPSKAWRPDHDV
ncbi:MAG: ice-binding family protein [Mycetocola sp.]